MMFIDFIKTQYICRIVKNNKYVLFYIGNGTVLKVEERFSCGEQI